MRTSKVASVDPDAMASFQAKYDTHGFIHKGAYGQVWRCTERATGREFTCKVVQRTEGKEFFPAQLVSLRNEAYVLQKLLGNCPGVVKAHDAIVTSDSMHLVMELCRGGDLQKLISSRGALPEASARLVFCQLASALQQLHSRNVVHRDIKPGNILLDRDATCLYSSNNQNANSATWEVQAKLGDLGMAAVLAPGELACADVGTRGYEAPEILRGAPYGAAVDVWSLGAVLCVLLTGRLPFRRDPADALGQRMAVLRGHVDFSRPCWGGVKEDARDLVRRMLRAEPGRRPKAEELLRHPWCATPMSRTAVSATAASTAPATHSTVPAHLEPSVKPVVHQAHGGSNAILGFPGGSRTTQTEQVTGGLGQERVSEGETQASGPAGKGQGRKLRWLQRLAIFSRNSGSGQLRTPGKK